MDVLENPRSSLTTANRILVHEGVLDAFGHVSVRHPSQPDRFFLACSMAPELVTEHDILEYDLTGQPVIPTDRALYSERVIHSVLYRMRPDVYAICHHHSPAIMPFCLTDMKLGVVTQLGAVLGTRCRLGISVTSSGQPITLLRRMLKPSPSDEAWDPLRSC